MVWYYQSNPRDSPEIIKMRMFFKKRNMDVGKFINLDKNEQIEFAYKNKHPYYHQSIMFICFDILYISYIGIFSIKSGFDSFKIYGLKGLKSILAEIDIGFITSFIGT